MVTACLSIFFVIESPKTTGLVELNFSTKLADIPRSSIGNWYRSTVSVQDGVALGFSKVQY